MEISQNHTGSLDDRLAERLRSLRAKHDWSLDERAQRCGVSRATLSRLENAEVSPTASVLGRLCAAYSVPMSRLLAMVEKDFEPLVPAGEQPCWEDPETGFRRRKISPPAETLNAEVLECDLPPGTRLAYPDTPRPGLEHHLYMLSGHLTLSVDGQQHRLSKGDCMRYQLHGPSVFETSKSQSAKYILVMV